MAASGSEARVNSTTCSCCRRQPGKRWKLRARKNREASPPCGAAPGGASIGQADATQQVLKTWVAAQRVVGRIHLERDQDTRMLRVSIPQPSEGLVLIAQANVSPNEG